MSAADAGVNARDAAADIDAVLGGELADVAPSAAQRAVPATDASATAASAPAVLAVPGPTWPLPPATWRLDGPPSFFQGAGAARFLGKLPLPARNSAWATGLRNAARVQRAAEALPDLVAQGLVDGWVTVVGRRVRPSDLRARGGAGSDGVGLAVAAAGGAALGGDPATAHVGAGTDVSAAGGGGAGVSKQLYPGGASRLGFLASGETLEDVVARDATALRTAGISVQQLATASSAVVARLALAEALAGCACEGVPVRLTADLVVRRVTWAAAQQCPLCPHDGRAGDGSDNSADTTASRVHAPPGTGGVAPECDFLLERRRVDDADADAVWVRMAGLLPHLADVHAFFEGDVFHRTDPLQLAAVLGVSPASPHHAASRLALRVWRVKYHGVADRERWRRCRSEALQRVGGGGDARGPGGGGTASLSLDAGGGWAVHFDATPSACFAEVVTSSADSAAPATADVVKTVVIYDALLQLCAPRQDGWCAELQIYEALFSVDAELVAEQRSSPD